MLNTKDIVIASFLLKFKKRAPVIHVPDLLAPGNTAKDCQMPMNKISLEEISESLRLLGLRSEKKSNRANRTLANAIISICLDNPRKRVYSKNKAIIISGMVPKEIKKNDFVIPYFLNAVCVFRFIGLAKIKITANKLPKCMAMSIPKLLLRPITNLL